VLEDVEKEGVCGGRIIHNLIGRNVNRSISEPWSYLGLYLRG
jgi:hypothetical protein